MNKEEKVSEGNLRLEAGVGHLVNIRLEIPPNFTGALFEGYGFAA